MYFIRESMSPITSLSTKCDDAPHYERAVNLGGPGVAEPARSKMGATRWGSNRKRWSSSRSRQSSNRSSRGRGDDGRGQRTVGCDCLVDSAHVTATAMTAFVAVAAVDVVTDVAVTPTVATLVPLSVAGSIIVNVYAL